MKQALAFEEFKLLAKNAKRIAVFEEIKLRKLTPVDVYNLLTSYYQAEGVIFEECDQDKRLSYSYICFEKIASCQINDDKYGHPLTVLRALQLQYQYSTRAEVASLLTNSIGLMAYDLIRYYENIPDRHLACSTPPLCLFHFYALNLAVDHKNNSVLISYIVEVGEQLEKIYGLAKQKIQKIIQLLAKSIDNHELKNNMELASNSNQFDEKKFENKMQLTMDVSDADFIKMVEQAKNYIRCGDIFQVVLSRSFKKNYTVSEVKIYQTLRQISASPYLFYFPIEEGVLIGASPERLIQVHHGQITVNPIAGTRERVTHKTDREVESELLTDKKEIAEHIMLVDLARNDVGAVSQAGSVKVEQFLQVKHYSHVSHITSTISGKLKENHDALNALISVFPAGTLSGAPKIRAMQIIDELEISPRAWYGGAICRFDSIGNLDSCIAIRSALLQKGVAIIRAGAGIVSDSNPVNEMQETYQKANSIIEAIMQAEEDKCY